MPDWQVVLLAAAIGAGSSIAGTALTMWWSSRQQRAQSTRDEAAALRAEKRQVYRDVIQALDAWREVVVDLDEYGQGNDRWKRFWEAQQTSLKATAALQLVGSEAMIEAASEVAESLIGVGEPRHWAEGVVYRDIWSHITASDRDARTMLNLMRADLGMPPLPDADGNRPTK